MEGTTIILDEKYNYNVTAGGYYLVSKTSKINGDNLSINVMLTRLIINYAISLTIEDDDNLIEGTIFTLNSEKKITYNDGIVAFTKTNVLAKLYILVL